MKKDYKDIFAATVIPSVILPRVYLTQMESLITIVTPARCALADNIDGLGSILLWNPAKLDKLSVSLIFPL